MSDLYKGKKIIVLGGASQHCKVVEAAKNVGLKVYVADYLVDSPAKRIADVPLLINVMDVDALVEVCKNEKIDGAIATSLDACQLPYQKLCEKMNFPCFGDKTQFKTLTNKQSFKHCCKEYGVDTIPSYSIEDIESDNNIEYPVFIKPVDSRGSRGQSICYNKDGVKKAIEKASREASDGNFLIEKYMGECQDFTVAYLFANGEGYIVRTGDRFEGSKGTGLENLCVASCSPSVFTEKYISNANEPVIKMLKGIGIKNAPIFFQGFIDGDKIRFYDPGLRFAGGEYERILKSITGEDIISYLVKYAITGSSIQPEFDDDIWKLKGKRITQLDPTLKPGKIKKISGVEEIKKMDCIVAVSQRVSEGDTIVKSNDLGQRFGEFCIVSDNLNDEIANIKKIQDYLRVIDENDMEMIFDSFDTDKLNGDKLLR